MKSLKKSKKEASTLRFESRTISLKSWSTQMYCETCGSRTKHIGRKDGREEVYECEKCGNERSYTVR